MFEFVPKNDVFFMRMDMTEDRLTLGKSSYRTDV